MGKKQLARNNRNPFTPTFGSVPPVLAGREQIVGDMLRGLDNGVGDPHLCTLLTGARGTGKTALMAYIAAEAQERGWLHAGTTAVDGMLEDIAQQAFASAASFVPAAQTRVVSLDTATPSGAGGEPGRAFDPNWRTRMGALIDQLQEHDMSLLITVDGAKTAVPEMKQLVTTYQHFVREQKPVALLIAGLPHKMYQLVNNDDVSFLRRATLHTIGNVSVAQTQEAMRSTVTAAGRTIGKAVELAAQASQGYAYLIQLIGYYMWEANPSAEKISKKDVNAGIEAGFDEFEQRVLQATYRSLSDGDLRFLACMLQGGDDVAVTDITKRLGVKPNYTSKYKLRLVEQGIIGETRRGRVQIELPMFKEYLEKVGI